ncbi:MAG TPA: hypothetical protein VN048_12960 [Verrucomicrobiae bacterium]|jgi:hypothetical protein|nr:hypothetical protein [Verrucomicrobiae bacterium]
MNTTTITDETNGVITRVTTIHHDYFNYHWLILGVVAFGLLAWALRKIFWEKDSN